MNSFLALLTIIIYGLAGWQLCRGLRTPASTSRPVSRLGSKYAEILGLLGILLHAYLLHRWIDVSGVQNLTLFNLLSMGVWLVIVILFILQWMVPMANLLLISYPLAILSIILGLIFKSYFLINTQIQLPGLFHILLAIMTFAVFCVGALQAIVLALFNAVLRSKRSFVVVEQLPPIETMEKILFQILLLGFVLLSALLGSGLYAYHHLLLQSPRLMQKTVLVGITWFILCGLLIGRYKFGWRGNKAIYGTLIAVLLIIIIYFGSNWVMEALS